MQSGKNNNGSSIHNTIEFNRFKITYSVTKRTTRTAYGILRLYNLFGIYTTLYCDAAEIRLIFMPKAIVNIIDNKNV